MLRPVLVIGDEVPFSHADVLDWQRSLGKRQWAVRSAFLGVLTSIVVVVLDGYIFPVSLFPSCRLMPLSTLSTSTQICLLDAVRDVCVGFNRFGLGSTTVP